MPKGTHEPEHRPLQPGQRTRTITARSVTFICQECGVETTEEQLPGPTRRYCTPCRGVVQRRRDAESQRRIRERRRRYRELRSRLEASAAIEDRRRA